MTDPDTFLFLITSQVVWKDAGWGIIVFLAALNAIDPALYESAAMDGAGSGAASGTSPCRGCAR